VHNTVKDTRNLTATGLYQNDQQGQDPIIHHRLGPFGSDFEKERSIKDLTPFSWIGA